MHEFHSYYYEDGGQEPITSEMRLPADAEMTPELLANLIQEHSDEHAPRLKMLRFAYEGRAAIFGRPRKESPDNRMAAAFPKYISDTFDGYFLGAPVTMTIADEGKQAWLREYNVRNGQDDVDAQLAKSCSNCGVGYEMLYQDEDGLPRSACVDPVGAFVVYDDTVAKRPIFAVRYWRDEEKSLAGEWMDAYDVVPFSDGAGVIEFGPGQPHGFGGVPMVEYRQNDERRGVYEDVLSLVAEYDKALSEKANDVDYFADSYMEVSGKELDEAQISNMRHDRVINLFGEDADKLRVQFLAKPSADAAQENLLDRLETLIFKLSMVPDISNESFGTASGIALKMRLLPMSNLATIKERKFKESVRRRLHLLANYPNQPFSGDDWQRVEISMQRNMPEDLASEAQVASQLTGIVSRETILAILSCVDDPAAEMQRIEAERESDATAYGEGWPTNRTAERSESVRDLQGNQEAQRQA